jgi:hypothetical protein
MCIAFFFYKKRQFRILRFQLLHPPLQKSDWKTHKLECQSLTTAAAAAAAQSAALA